MHELLKEFKSGSSANGRAEVWGGSMPSLIDIRRRIRSVKNTQQITKRHEDGFGRQAAPGAGPRLAARPYARPSARLLADVAAGGRLRRAIGAHPLLAERPRKESSSC
jgi:F-type H+-transporting ATPase subunit gamma